MPRTAAAPPPAPLARYRAKRDFEVTPEPAGVAAPAAERLSFVIQKHWATRLHYDFRLELDGVLLSWAVPKGPSFDPKEKRMAVHVEDHPVSYGTFEGTIPPKQYGAGTVIVWDRGTWEPVGDPHAGMREGKLVFRLHGQKLAGLWELVRIAKPGDRQDPWMLFKKRDEWARPLVDYDVIAALPDSVVEKPLGLVEEREPRGRSAGAAPVPAVRLQAATLPGAEEAEVPATLEPQLATLAKDVPGGGPWIYEVKFDGYRLLARIDAKGGVRLYTRKRNDWTSKMESLAEAVGTLGLRSTWLDGEILVRGPDGMPNFNALQNAFDSSRTDSIDYFLFDLPFADGFDLTRVPLKARRDLLAQLLAAHPNDRLNFSAAFDAEPRHLLDTVRSLGLEGIVAKRADSQYLVGRRSETWLKIKSGRRQEFVIGGWVDRTGSTQEVGGLLLGTFDGGQLVHSGNVGTGWDSKAAVALRKRLIALEQSECPFAGGPNKPGRWSRRVPGGEHWVRPELVAEVSFTEWTPDGHIRQGVYRGLRMDKPAASVTRETEAAPPAAPPKPPPTPKRTVKVSNPERVIDASTGLKKLDLVRYYDGIGERMLPHLKGRPVSLVRGPTGIAGQLFFQKHDDKLSIPGMRELDPALWPGHQALLEVPTADALVNCAQMNVIEFHTWNSTARKIDLPDRIVFDLDPGEGVKWPQVQEAALLVRTLLTELGLDAWLKTSGGKGLHVVVPIAQKLDNDTVKNFSQAVVQHMARVVPSRFVAKSGASNRVGKIFVDYLRNGHGATTAAAFSARARPGLGVSMPVAWEQLQALKGGAQWTIATAREYLSFEKQDPWAGYWGAKQSLAKPMKVLGFAPARAR